MTSVPDSINGGFHLNIEDFDDLSVSWSSFPSIHFSRLRSLGGAPGASDSAYSGDEDESSGLFKSSSRSWSKSRPQTNVLGLTSANVPYMPPVSRTLYVQMVRLLHSVDGMFDLMPHGMTRNLLNDRL